MMHIDPKREQIRFSLDGDRVTLSCRRHLRRSTIEFAILAHHIDRLLEARVAGLAPPPASLQFLDRIPRKLRSQIESRLIAKPSLSLGDRLDEYEFYRATELATAVDTDRAVIEDCSLLPRDWDCRAITEQQLRELLEHVASQRSYAPSTCGRIVKHWRAFFNWLTAVESLATNPAKGLPYSIGRRTKDEVRPEWIDAMVDRCRVWEGRFWLRFLQWTGCRQRESLRLCRRDFDIGRRRIAINDTKRGVVREAPLYRAIEAELPSDFERWPPDQQLLSWLNPGRCVRWFDAMRERANVPQWRPRFNAIRAMRANQLAADPRIKPEAYQVLLGHSTRTAVANYLSLDDSMVEMLR